ncbi:MAG: FHA domain-containing protein [Lentisphaerae bacterium]|nr:FHA domain-containing protein [Lentisphaerota bacterium]
MPGKFVISIIKGPALSRTFTFDQDEVVVGRGAEVDLPLDDDRSVSRRHAVICLRKHQVHILDAGSKAGTFVRDKRVKKATVLSGEAIRFGDSVITVDFEAPSGHPIRNESNASRGKSTGIVIACGILLLLLLVLLLVKRGTQPATSPQGLERAIAARNEGDLGSALHILQQLIQHGADPDGQIMALHVEYRALKSQMDFALARETTLRLAEARDQWQLLALRLPESDPLRLWMEQRIQRLDRSLHDSRPTHAADNLHQP